MAPLAGTPRSAAEREGFGYVSDSLDKMANVIQNILSKEYPSESSSSSLLKERLVALDLVMNKLEKIHKFTIPLRFHRNHLTQMSQIHILPDEILIIIFHYWWDERIKTCRRSAMGKQLLLSWVCQRWRALINNNPAFWVYINNRAPKELLQKTIQRSQNMALHIKLICIEDKSKFKHEEKIIGDIIGGGAHRIETLRAVPGTKNLWKSIVRNPEITTSRLRYLNFSDLGLMIELESCSGTYIDLKQFVSKLERRTPSRLFYGKAFMSRIRELKFVEDRERGENGFRIDLNHCLKLEVLDLHIQMGTEVGNRIKKSASPTLGQLHTLILHSERDLVLFGHLQLPSLRRLVCYLDSSSSNDFQLIKRHADFSRIKLLGIGAQGLYDSCDCFQIDGTSEDPDNPLTCCATSFAYYNGLSPEHQSNSRIQFCFKFRGADCFYDLSVFLKSILVEATNVDKIIFRRSGMPSDRGFAAFFTNRRCIALTIQSIQNMHDILEKLCDNNICCGLEELALSPAPNQERGVPFMTRTESAFSEPTEHIAFAQAIFKLAQTRRERGSPIRRIHIKHSSTLPLPENVTTGLSNLGVEFVETIDDKCVFYNPNDCDRCHCPCFGCLQDKCHNQWNPQELEIDYSTDGYESHSHFI